MSAPEVLASHPALPVNTAVIECVPKVSAEVENVALPVVVLTATPDARVVVPSLKAIVPWGMPFEEVTVAVKVTDAPEFDGFAEDATEFEVAI